MGWGAGKGRMLNRSCWGALQGGRDMGRTFKLGRCQGACYKVDLGLVRGLGGPQDA